MSLAERLRFARQSLNLTLEEVGRDTDVGVSTLSEFENGKREPRLFQLKVLADLYRRSTSFFLEEGPLPTDVVRWRCVPTAPKVEDLQTDLLRLTEHYYRLELLCDDDVAPDLMRPTGDPEHFSEEQAEKLAHDFRIRHGLGERPGQSLLRVVEEVCKVKVFHLPFEPLSNSACTWHERFGAAVLLNAKQVRWQRNIDLAHELFHLMTWSVFRRSAGPACALSSDHEARLASVFARNLLLPQEPLRIAIDALRGKRTKLSFDDLFEVARQFDTSIDAVLRQMQFVFHCPEGWGEATRKKFNDHINIWNARQQDFPPLRPLRFEALAAKALATGLISTGKYAEYVGVTRREAMRRLEQEVYDDAEIEITHS